MTDPQDPTVEPDGIVRTALQLLPVPPHRTDFWAHLDRLLDEEPVPASRGRIHASPTVSELAPAASGSAAPPSHTALRPIELVADDSQTLVPAALRRRSNAVLAVIAVAAAALVVVAGSTLVRERGGSLTTDDDGGSAVSSELQDLMDDAQHPGRVTEVSDGTAEAASEAVLAWIAALGESDRAAAWNALGPSSQAHFGSRAEFESDLTSLSEGYGAWSAVTPDAVLVTPVRVSDDDALVVVTLVGTIAPEGVREHRADAFLVRVTDGSARLEPFASAGELEVVVPETGEGEGGEPVHSMEAGDSVVVVVPASATAPVIRIDDDETLVCGEAPGTELVPLDSAPGQRCSYRPADGITTGQRVLTVAFESADGTAMTARSVVFEAA